MFEIFRNIQHSPQTDEYTNPLVNYYNVPDTVTLLNPVKLKNKFSMVYILTDTSDDTYFYHPLQAKQVCFRDLTNNVNCKLIESKHTDISETPTGFGGNYGIDAPWCKPGLKPIGITCLSGFNGPTIQVSTASECALSGNVLLEPEGLMQNTIIKAYMIENVSMYFCYFLSTVL